MSQRIRMVAICSHEPCSEIFSKRPSEIINRPRAFCNTDCYRREITTGRTMVEVPCSGKGCTNTVKRTPYEASRHKRSYCSPACFVPTVDYKSLGSLGGGSHEIDPEKKTARSRLGGIARARNLTPERRREIAMIAVAARNSMSKEDWRKNRRQGAVTNRFGPDVALGVRLGKRP